MNHGFRLQWRGAFFLLVAFQFFAGWTFPGQFASRSELENRQQLKFVARDRDRCALGRLPADWIDLSYARPSRNWGGDAAGALRFIEKHRTGLLACTAPLPGPECVALEFSKTEDAAVTVGVMLRVRDAASYDALILTGDDELRLIRKRQGRTELLGSLVSLRKYRAGERWQIWFSAQASELSGVLFDAAGKPLGQLDALATTQTQGAAGVLASEFVAIHALQARTPAGVATPAPDPHAASAYQGYDSLKPDPRAAALVRKPPEKLQKAYDLIVAGAGTGGVCAAVQAARMGCSVLLVEETDWIGGQMSAAAVTSMDEGHIYCNYQDRERGLYREFHEAMLLYYYGLDKSPWQAYYANLSPRLQENGGYEPRVTQDLLYALLADAATRGHVAVDVVTRQQVGAVTKKGARITGVRLAGSLDKTQGPEVRCGILIDATEYGDVLPLTGARYRAGNTIAPMLNLDATPQDNTWTCVLREYPEGIPQGLRIVTRPPHYDEYRKHYVNHPRQGLYELTAGSRMWRSYFAWRGMADTFGPLVGRTCENRHTRCGINGGNDYPTTVRGLEDPGQRRREELSGIERSLAALYYFQNEVGVNWSVATDEGYATAYNRANMRRFNLPEEYYRLAIHFPQKPYVRESRRIVGLHTLKSSEIGRFERAVNQPHSVAINDYGVDLHRTEEFLEADLDAKDYDRGGGPFQVPLEAFIPEKLDGLLAAEKNLSQSRIVSGATRMQPSTMLTGQAVGALAAISIKNNTQPRAVNVLEVQQALLRAGSTLAPRWHRDVAWGTEAWRAVQLLSLYAIWDMPGPLSVGTARLGTCADWGWNEPLQASESKAVVNRLGRVLGRELPVPPTATRKYLSRQALQKWAAKRGVEFDTKQDGAQPARRGELALVCARLLLREGRLPPVESQP